MNNIDEETVDNNYVVELLDVSGILFLSLDEELHTFKFADHIKIKIIFDKKVVNGTNDSHLTNICERTVESKPEAITRDSFEDNDSITDDSDFDVNENSNVCQEAYQTTPVQHEDKMNDEESKMLNSKTSGEIAKVSIFKSKAATKFRLKKAVIKLTPLENPSLDTNNFQGEEIAEVSKPPKTSKASKIKNETTEVKVKKREIKEDIQCRYCNKCFNSRKEYNTHHKPERKNYRCEICHRNLRFQAYLMIHMQNKISKSDMKAKGTQSGLLNSKLGMKRNTCESRLRSMKSLKCHICGITVTTLQNLKTHTLSHTGEYQYECCVCGRHVRAHGTLKRHLGRHFKSGQVECKICNLTFSNRTEFSKHRRLTHAFLCGLCGEVFPNKTVRKFHYKTCHKEDILKCPQCEGLYSCQEDLAKHLKEHQIRPRTQCPVCGVFVCRLGKHMLSRHGANLKDSPDTNNIYVCDKCPRQFSNKYAFQAHVEVHSEEKRYTCTVCSKQFARCGGLSRHMRIHMDEKLFVCEICGKGCNQPGNLKVHMRTHRTPSILHCRHCGLSFSQKDDLEEHITSMHISEGNVEGSAVQVLQSSQVFF